jgi:hypothetical protein
MHGDACSLHRKPRKLKRGSKLELGLLGPSGIGNTLLSDGSRACACGVTGTCRRRHVCAGMCSLHRKPRKLKRGSELELGLPGPSGIGNTLLSDGSRACACGVTGACRARHVCAGTHARRIAKSEEDSIIAAI